MCFKLLSCFHTRRKDCDTNTVFTAKLELPTTRSRFWSSRKCYRKNSASLWDFKETNDFEYLAARDCGLQIFGMNDFVFGEEVGRGTNSQVRLLVRGDDKVKFAGKMLDQCSWWSLINEASIMSELSGMCANIVSVEGIIVKCKCLVLPYYRNGDLGTALMRDDQKVNNGSKSEFPFFKRLKYIMDVCNALSFLHKSSICHRDLAIRNLLLSDDMERVLLTDFTLSRFVDLKNNKSVTFTSELPILSAPETFKRYNLESTDQGIGGWQYSLKTDIWGLGITMFEIITKKNFKPTHWKQKMPAKLPQSSLPPKHIFNKGWDLWFAICCCWNTKLEKRPWSWEVMDKINYIIENPLGANKGNLYHRGYSLRQFATPTSSSMICVPTTYSMTEFLTEKSSEMEFSDWVTGRRHHSSRESILRNPNFNLTPTLERSKRKVFPTKSDSCSSLLRRGYVESCSLSGISSLKLNLVNDYSNVTNVAYCKDRHFFDTKKMINQQEMSSNLYLQNEISGVTNFVCCGDWHFCDEKKMAYQPELITSNSCNEVFPDNQLSNCSSVIDSPVTQCSFYTETISEPTKLKLHLKTFETSNGISFIL